MVPLIIVVLDKAAVRTLQVARKIALPRTLQAAAVILLHSSGNSDGGGATGGNEDDDDDKRKPLDLFHSNKEPDEEDSSDNDSDAEVEGATDDAKGVVLALCPLVLSCLLLRH